MMSRRIDGFCADLPAGVGAIDIGLPVAVRQRLRVPRKLTLAQIEWLAHRPYVFLGADVRAVYEALARHGFRHLVPMAYWDRMEQDHYRRR